MRRTVLIIVALLTIPLSVWASKDLIEDWQNKAIQAVEWEASAVYHIDEKIYTYEYEATSLPVNNANVLLIKIDISKTPGRRELSSEGLMIDGNSRLGLRSFDQEMAFMSITSPEPVIPVGLSTGSKYRSASISTHGTVFFGTTVDGKIIRPGESSGKLFIHSRGIPGIRKFEVAPSYIATMDEISEFNKRKEKPHEYIDEAGEEFYDSLSYFGKTIGPTAPPAELDPIAFIDNIISMKHEAVDLGWITNQGIVISLDQKLEAAKQKLEQGNARAAKNILGAFIKEVEAQGCESYESKCKGKHILPEAYALLKYNAKYLVDNLE